MPGYQYRGTQRDAEAPAVVRSTPAATPKPAKATLPVWEEPPAPKRGGNAYMDRTVEQLKRKPGQWARVKDGMRNSACAATWKKRGCEAVARKPEGADTYSVWARWPQ